MNTFLPMKAGLFAAVLTLGTIGSQPAGAACFESGVDCTDDHDIPVEILDTLSCDALWTVRNMIFDENGYCFQTAKALAVFSNEGCQFTNMAAMPLNQFETANIQTIRQVEKQKACY
jgi:YARHG domain